MDLFQTEFVLPFSDRELIINNLKELGGTHCYCGACGSATDISFMRRKPAQTLNEAMCLPCFLNNYTATDQDGIDRIVEIGIKRGFYID